MARPLRLHVQNGFYHVTLRGNHRQPIFREAPDRELLDGIVAEAAGELGALVHAYCWMTNHIHVLVQVSDTPLGKIILRIASRYARKYQEHLGTTGHLFERRYHAVLVDADSYLLTLVRYIHLNPVRAGLVADPGEYPWSSHRDYLGARHTAWVCTSMMLRMLSPDSQRAQIRYLDWMNERDGARWGEGCLVPHPDNPQVLGDDRFLAKVTMRAASCRERMTIDDLLAECARRFGLGVDCIASVSRSRALSAARAWLYHEAVDRGIASVSAIARRLKRSESAVRAMMLRHSSAKME